MNYLLKMVSRKLLTRGYLVEFLCMHYVFFNRLNFREKIEHIVRLKLDAAVIPFIKPC